MIDHIIFASPTLESGIDFIEKKLGIRPVYSGQHLGRGTHNALLALGKNTYLEVIAPDPTQPPSDSLWMKTHLANQPQLWTWAAKSADLFHLEKIAQEHQIPFGKIESGSRTQVNGNVLSWQLSLPVKNNEEGLIPFFLDWGKTIHPATTLPQAGEVVSFKFYHPRPVFFQNQIQQLGLDFEVIENEQKFFEVKIRTSKGVVVFQSK